MKNKFNVRFTNIFTSILSKGLMVLAVIASISFLSSCQKEASSENSQQKSQEIVRKTLHEFAKNLAIDLHKGSPKIKTKMVELYPKTAEEFLLAELLDDSRGNDLNLRSASVYNTLLATNPELTVAYPALTSGESFSDHINSIDYVVVLDDAVDIESPLVTSLNAYDASGNLVTISSAFNDNLNYAVVKNSEIFQAVHDNTYISIDGIQITSQIQNFSPYMEIGNWNLYSTADIANAEFMELGIYGGGPPPSPTGGSGGAPTCDRDPRTKKDELHKIKFDGHYVERTYESRWRMPFFEMSATYAIFKGGTNNSNVQLIQKAVRRHKDDVHGIYCPNLQLDISTWTAEMGDKWQVAWVEVDDRNTSKIEFNLGFTTKIDTNSSATASVKYSIDFRNGDKLLGSNLVEFCDPAIGEGTEYKVCDVNGQGFWFRERIKN